jgi:heme oxygenase
MSKALLTIDLLNKGKPLTVKDVSEKLNIPYKTAAEVFRVLYKRKKVHVASWIKVGNSVVRVYKIGQNFDAPRPLAKTQQRSVETQIRIDLLAQGRVPFDELNPRCDVAASWIKRKSCQDTHTR